MGILPGGRAPQHSDKNSYTNQMQFYEMRASINRLQQQQRGFVPLRGVIGADLTAADIVDYFVASLGLRGGPYEGWAICDGLNGTPNLLGTFPRWAATAGTTGGSDSSAHTHAIDHDHGSFTSGATALTSAMLAAHTHAVGTLVNDSETAHTHGIGSYVAANESTHTHGIGSYVAANESAHTHASLNVGGGAVRVVMDAAAGATRRNIAYTGGDATGNDFGVTAGSAHTHTLSGTSAAGAAHTHTLSGTSAAGSSHTHTISGSTASTGSGDTHTHAVDVPALTGTSGAASSSDNRPAFAELVPLMWLGT